MDEYVLLKNTEKKGWVLSQEALEFIKNGTPEYILYQMIGEVRILNDCLFKGIEKEKIPVDLFKFGFQNGMKKKWFGLSGTVVKKSKDSVEDEDAISLKKIQNH